MDQTSYQKRTSEKLVCFQTHQLSTREAQFIAKLHKDILYESSLTHYGEKFLSAFYSLISKKKNTITLLIKNNENVIGYSVTILNKKRLMYELLIPTTTHLTIVWEAIKHANLQDLKMTKSSGDMLMPELVFLAVQPNYRHQGVGTKLLEETEQIISKINFNQLMIKTDKNNAIANKFYAKNKYSLINTQKTGTRILNIYTKILK